MSSALFLVGCAHTGAKPSAQALQGCPRSDLAEAPSDCPWAQWVREVEAGVVTTSHLPEVIDRSLQLDARDVSVHDAWGQSLNFDSGARAEIVSRAVLQELAKKFGVELVTQDGLTRQHAGLIHTYGYLLSNLRTPYGYKRARWVGGVLDRGFGLPENTLGPSVLGSSTLLSRSTYLFMRVALHQHQKDWKKWASRLSVRATRELKMLSLGKIRRREEEFRLKTGEIATLVTDLVPLPYDPDAGKLLVYSVRRGGKTSLITGFPVLSSFQEKPANPVRPRYNAWLE